jgi:hypothetical protein
MNEVQNILLVSTHVLSVLIEFVNLQATAQVRSHLDEEFSSLQRECQKDLMYSNCAVTVLLRPQQPGLNNPPRSASPICACPVPHSGYALHSSP